MAVSSNSDDMQKIKRDAIKRAQEMKKRATPNKDEKTKNEESDSKGRDEIKRQNKPKEVNILDSLLKDGERMLILVLVMILSSEEVDIGLILALMYLII